MWSSCACVRITPRTCALLGQEVREVRDHVVHARHLVVREHQAAVDGQEVLARLDQHHVEADLAEATERDDPDAGLDRGVAGGAGRDTGRDDAVGHTGK